MTFKTEKFLQNMQNLQKFIGDSLLKDSSYSSADQSLKELSETLKAGKLKLNIVSQDITQAETLQRLLVLDGKLQNSYQIKSFSLPHFFNSKAPSPTLILQSAEVSSPISYELKVSDSQVIGRNPASAQILLPDRFSLVSGSHTEIRCMDNEWQIRDLGSRNGTFIHDNPQKLQDWYTLKGGDCIHLGAAAQGSGSAALIFEISPQADADLAQVEAQKILNCNILCIVISSQLLEEKIQQLLQFQGASISKIFFLVDRPGDISIEDFKETIAKMRMEDSIKNQLQDTSCEFIPLLLKPFTPTSGATVITPHAQPEFESFCYNLATLSQEKAAVILTGQASVQLIQIVSQLELALVKQVETSREILQQNEAKYKELSQGNFKKQADKVSKKVDAERDSLFKQIRSELTQSKVNLLNEHRQSSITYKIQQFAKHLQPYVIDQNGYRYVRLTVKDSNTSAKAINAVHTAATELCHTELTRWATAEWIRIQSEYCDGGLKSFLERSYQSLHFIPELDFSNEGFSISQSINVQSVLNLSNVEPAVELRYKQVNLPGYMLKNLKGQVIAIAGLLTMLGGGAISGGLLAPILFPFVAVAAWLSYTQEKEAKIEESAERLRKETISYYQSYVKGLIDRLVQSISGLLDVEEKRFRETLDNAKEAYALYQAELDKTQNELKAQIAEMKLSGQNKIEKDLSELRELKQSIL